MKILSRKFYQRDTVKVAHDLLGKTLIHENNKGPSSGKIVEVEAYLGENDPGSHAFRGITPRNKIMFGQAGLAYVYFIYGNHFLFNVVTEQQGKAGAVLIRALEPLQGIRLMRERRKYQDARMLTNGPGKLTQALNITREKNGSDLTKGPLRILNGRREKLKITSSPRIGIKKGSEKLLRFYLADSEFVSKK
ncbi:DNA-3-methyladenine glycosylase [candidate division NPL-UPA2 bacterium]|nr:DNA-3-methyladenine glycosylase [candidate division NPL-UPA2 bacterium]